MKFVNIYLVAFIYILISSGINGQIKSPNGEKVLFRYANRHTFSVAFVISGGTANYTKSNEGIENFALNWAVKGGIKNISPEELLKKIDSLGIEIEVISDLDYSAITITGLKRYWKSSFDIFTKILTEPLLDEDIYEDIKSELSLNAHYSQQDAENKLYLLSIQQLFGGRDYHKVPEGSPASLKQLQPSDVINYLTQLRDTQKGFIAVVGNFNDDELAQIKSLAESTFQDSGLDFPNKLLEIPKTSSISINEEKIKTNYLRGMIPSPALFSDEGFPMLLGIGVLNSRIFQRIRNEEGLSYGPEAYYAMGVIQNPYSVVRLDTESPQKALDIIIELLEEIQKYGVTEKELENQKSNYLTQRYLGEESTLDICKNLYLTGLRNQLFTTNEFNQKIKEVKVVDVNETLKKYLDNIYWTYLGNPELLSKK